MWFPPLWMTTRLFIKIWRGTDIYYAGAPEYSDRVDSELCVPWMMIQSEPLSIELRP